MNQQQDEEEKKTREEEEKKQKAEEAKEEEEEEEEDDEASDDTDDDTDEVWTKICKTTWCHFLIFLHRMMMEVIVNPKGMNCRSYNITDQLLHYRTIMYF